MVEFAYLNNRIKRLEYNDAKKADVIDEPLSDHFRVAVSCPPDTSIYIRGGNMWEGSDWGNLGAGYYIESATADLSDPDNIDGYTGNFTIANYYIGVVFGRAFYGEDWFCVGGGTEYATAAEAEAYIEDTALLSAPWKGYNNNGGLPLCGLVLKNSGSTGINGAIMPIDTINRGRSYVWPRDLRPRHYVAG